MNQTSLPNTTDRIFLTDAGFETSMLFHKEFELPHFAAFPLLRTKEGRDAMTEYFVPFIDLARQHDAGYVLDTNTWRANPDWGTLLGYDLDELEKVNSEAVEFAKELKSQYGNKQTVLINGVIGPRGDGYNPASIMSSVEAKNYHKFQVDVFSRCNVDMVSALTITNTPEAIGIADAAADANIPCVISFTLETDGCLPTGQLLADAIAEVDADDKRKPAYFMINCAHPDHFQNIVDSTDKWLSRIGGLRANASRMSHAELDCCEELDEGDPKELGTLYVDLRKKLHNLNVLGGCCGTDHRHVAQICQALNQ
jgi:S-methylmethionine-dependent homocysteine/selenocysteine methylase